MANDAIAEQIWEMQDEINRSRAHSGVLVMSLYQFLIREGLTTRGKVHAHLSEEAAEIDEQPGKAKVKKMFETLATIFQDETPPDPRTRFQVIEGGLSE